MFGKTKESNPKEEKFSLQNELREVLQVMVQALVFITLFFTFVGTVFTVSGSSMYPTLHDGEAMFIRRLAYTPARGDIVVIHTPTFPDREETEAIVKRVIAVGGQEVEIDYDENCVYVDGIRQEEDYLNFENWSFDGTLSSEFGEDFMVKRVGMTDFDRDGNFNNDYFKVPEGCVFVMGDNRNGSSDSRYAETGEDGEPLRYNLGMVDNRYVVGKASAVFFPVNSVRMLG